MKNYRVKVIEEHVDYVWIKADSDDAAMDLAMAEANCEYSCVYDCVIVDEEEIKSENESKGEE